FSSRRRHTRFSRDWSSDVCSSDLEYMGARRPILAVWDGMAANLVQQTQTGLVAHPDNPEQIADRLLELFDLWERNHPFPFGDPRSEERRVGKECGTRRSPRDARKR